MEALLPCVRSGIVCGAVPLEWGLFYVCASHQCEWKWHVNVLKSQFLCWRFCGMRGKIWQISNKATLPTYLADYFGGTIEALWKGDAHSECVQKGATELWKSLTIIWLNYSQNLCMTGRCLARNKLCGFMYVRTLMMRSFATIVRCRLYRQAIRSQSENGLCHFSYGPMFWGEYDFASAITMKLLWMESFNLILMLMRLNNAWNCEDIYKWAVGTMSIVICASNWK